MFADRIAFVDVETTGASPRTARMTEVGIVTVERIGPGDAPQDWQAHEWSSLIDPGCAIPPEIQFLTGIRPDMLVGAPRFEQLADALQERLHGAVFVAHNARFDYAFLKQEFQRCGREFTAKTLCTVRLSRLLDPDRSPHSLDAVIARHRLPAEGRHRALGDARVLWAFIRKVWLTHGAETVTAATRRLLRHPSLPSHLPPDTLERIPRAPGVYQFHGLNAHPLYIGMSGCLRDRVADHFTGDHRSDRGVRLATEVHRIDWQRTAGELGARLLEARWIRERMPAHNVALRRRLAEVVIEPWIAPDACDASAGTDTASAGSNASAATADPERLRLRIRKLTDVEPQDLPGCVGPFSSRAAARARLLALAAEHGLCARVLGLERGDPGRPCFNRQLGRCQGACIGMETIPAMASRLAELTAAWRIPAWPYEGPIVLNETGSRLLETDGAASGLDCWHVFDRWTHLGSVADEAAALELARRAPQAAFDSQTYRLLRQTLEALPADVTLGRVDATIVLSAPGAPPNCGAPAASSAPPASS